MAQAPPKFHFEIPNSPLQNFSEEKILELTEAYQTAPTVRGIAENIDGVSGTNLYRYLPYILSDESCEKCGHPIYTKIPTRTYAEKGEKKLCSNCRHDFTENCNCNYCNEKRREAFARDKAEYERQAHQWLKSQESNAYQPSEIGLLEEIQFQLLFNNYESGQGLLNFNVSHFHQNKRFIEVPPEFINFTNRLINKKILIPDGYPKYDKFHCEKDKHGNYIFSLNMFNALWKLNIDFAQNQEAYLNDLREKDYSKEELAFLWEQVYRQELLLYLDNRNDYYLNNMLDLNLLDVYLDDLMEHYSLAKAYAIIYFTSMDCLKYIHKYSPNRKALRTRFLNLLESNIERNKKNPNLKDYNRLDLKMSHVNDFIITNILKIEPHYFNLKTSEILNIVTQKTIIS